jgi:hypothetical protein
MQMGELAMTPLDKTIKRSLAIKGLDYVVTLTPDALKLTRKGKRLGMELKWADITSGESALAIALHASVGRFDASSTPQLAKAERLAQSSSTPDKSVPRLRHRTATRGRPRKQTR